MNMNKTKLRAFLLTIAALLFAKPLYVDEVLKFTVLTTGEPLKDLVRAEYRLSENSETQHIRAYVKNAGRASFRIYAKDVAYVKIMPPAGKRLTAVKVIGKTKAALDIPEKYIFSPFPIQGKKHFDFKFFVIFGSFAYMLFYTLVKKQPFFDLSVPKIRNVEFLRLIFTFTIVLHHLTPQFEFFTKGYYGVEFFFVLSGLFLMLTFKPEKTTEGFVKSKIVHFIPLIVLCALFNGKLALLPANMLFLQGTGLTPAVPAQGWYLGVLFWVTLLYFCILKYFKPEPGKMLIAVLTFWALTDNDIGHGLQRGFAGIGLGCFLAIFWNWMRQKTYIPTRAKTVAYTCAEAGLLIYSPVLLFSEALLPENKVNIYIAYAGLILLFLLKRGKISQFFEKPFFAKISCCAFAIYMTHIDLTRAAYYHLLERAPNVFDDYKIALIAVNLVWCYLFGLMIWKYVELPAARWLKSKLQ